jgi:hypothetical protein
VDLDRWFCEDYRIPGEALGDDLGDPTVGLRSEGTAPTVADPEIRDPRGS